MAASILSVIDLHLVMHYSIENYAKDASASIYNGMERYDKQNL